MTVTPQRTPENNYTPYPPLNFRVPRDVRSWLEEQRRPGESLNLAAARTLISAARHDDVDTLTADDLAGVIEHYARRLAAMVPEE